MVWLVGIDDAEKIQGANGHTDPHQEAAGDESDHHRSRRTVVHPQAIAELSEPSGRGQHSLDMPGYTR